MAGNDRRYCLQIQWRKHFPRAAPGMMRNGEWRIQNSEIGGRAILSLEVILPPSQLGNLAEPGLAGLGDGPQGHSCRGPKAIIVPPPQRFANEVGHPASRPRNMAAPGCTGPDHATRSDQG